jgi:hypothetical protein
MLALAIHVLTIMLWATAAVAVCGIALGFLARTIMGRAPYRYHSRPVAAAIRWEKNWHRRTSREPARGHQARHRARMIPSSIKRTCGGR